MTALQASRSAVPDAAMYDQMNTRISTATARPVITAGPSLRRRRTRSATAVAGPATTTQASTALSAAWPTSPPTAA